jgi:glyoxylase-like metal-dependent hydrolase (beta-lactamase superfamily II)
MITRLDEDRLWALSHPYPVDGRVSWHAPSARGYAPMNCYMLREPDRATLVETGLGIHQEALMDEIAEGLGDRDLSIMLLRQGEFDSIFNLLPIVHTFGIKSIFGQYDTPLDWANFRNDARLSNDGTISYRGVDRMFPDLEAKVLSKFELIPVGGGRERLLEVFRPELLLLNTHWVYDAATLTLFTSDTFTYVVRPDADAGWVVTAEDDTTTADEVQEHLLNTRFWWLADAQVDEIRRFVAGVFERYDIETIAPSCGAILRGRDVVERHYTMLDEVIAKVGRTGVPA